MALQRGTIAFFLEALVDDDLEARFEETPVNVMVEFELDERQRNLILSGPISQIREEVENDLRTAGESDPVYVIRVKHG